MLLEIAFSMCRPVLSVELGILSGSLSVMGYLSVWSALESTGVLVYISGRLWEVHGARKGKSRRGLETRRGGVR